MECFAMDAETGSCRALKVDKCTGRRCAFFRTPEEHEQAQRAAEERLANLSDETQATVADRHYLGRRSWLKNV